MKKESIIVFIAAAIVIIVVCFIPKQEKAADPIAVVDFTESENTAASEDAASVPTVDESGIGNAVTGEGSVADKSAELVDLSKYPLTCPFSDATWYTKANELTSFDSQNHKTYDSVYGGTTHTYDHTYLEHEGTIKYMYDHNDALMCVAFSCSLDSNEELSELYAKIHDECVSKFGKSGYQASHSTNYGDVWYREEGDVIISTMSTSEGIALQYAYLNPIISKEQMENAAKQ